MKRCLLPFRAAATCSATSSISYDLGWLDPGHRLISDYGLKFLPPDACMSKEFVDFVFQMEEAAQGAPVAGLVMNTCRALEGEFIDVVAAQPPFQGQRFFAVGPLNPLLLDADARTTPGQAHATPTRRTRSASTQLLPLRMHVTRTGARAHACSGSPAPFPARACLALALALARACMWRTRPVVAVHARMHAAACHGIVPHQQLTVVAHGTDGNVK